MRNLNNSKRKIKLNDIDKKILSTYTTLIVNSDFKVKKDIELENEVNDLKLT